MGKPRLRFALVAVLPIAAAALLALLQNAGAQPAPAPAPSASLAAAPVVVTLITGDRVALANTIDGRPVVAFEPAGGPRAGSGYRRVTIGSHVFVIPFDATGFVGAPLDLSLFDVTALAAAASANPSVPLALDITASSSSVSASALPGITMTAPGKAKQASRDAARLGQAISAEAQARNRGAPTTGLFTGVTRIAIAGTAVTAMPGSMAGAAQPAGKLYTLTLKAFDRNGQKVPNTTFAVVYNVDDGNTFIAGQRFFNGTLSFSVPAGNYQITSLIQTGTGADASFAFVSAPQVNVNGNTVAVLEARKTTPVGANVPDPTSPVLAELTLQRDPAQGPNFTDSFTTFGPTPLYVSPTKPVSVGQQYFYPYFRLGDASGSLDRFLYDLHFEYVGAIPDQLVPTFSRSDLATVSATYHSSTPGRAQLEGRLSLAPWQSGADLGLTTLVAPLSRTEYVLPQADARFLQTVILDIQTSAGFTTDNFRTLSPGQQMSTDWIGQPEPPGIEQQGPGVAQSCPVCRSGDTLSTTFFPFVDPGGNRMLAEDDKLAGMSIQQSLYEKGTIVGDPQPGPFGQFPLDPDLPTHQLVMDVSRDASFWPTSTLTHTVWTFESVQRAPDPLPPGWTCGGKGGGGGGGGKGGASTNDRGGGGGGGGGGDGCSFEAFLFATYDTHAGGDDVVPAGRDASVDVTVARQAFAPRSTIVDFTFEVSFNDGMSWTPATIVALGGGHFQARYSQPALAATSGFASLHMTATDDGGSKIDQTITRAYPLAPLPPASGGGGGGKGAAPFSLCTTAVVAPYMQCMAMLKPSSSMGEPEQVDGYGPADIASAYRLPPGAGAGRTVAIVDAFDDPNAEDDLNTWRAQYGLPPCTTANGCFRKVNQFGADGPLPARNQGWGLEISLDLDAVSAACPSCKILLVEANTPDINDLAVGVVTAVRLGADAVSNSYGSRGEFAAEELFEPFYDHPGVAITVSSGDYGYGNGAILIGGVSYPGSSKFVTSVGGTTLLRDGSQRGWTETAWAGSTSGCSAYIHKPGWQKDRLCDKRSVADVAAVGDPNTGLAVYDTFGFDGWLVVGGTSLSSPIVASIYAMAKGVSGVQHDTDPRQLYRNDAALFDVVGGSTGTCGGVYLCTGLPGYDGPTGLGTPNGLGAF